MNAIFIIQNRLLYRVEVPFRTSHIKHLKAVVMFRYVQTVQSQ